MRITYSEETDSAVIALHGGRTRWEIAGEDLPDLGSVALHRDDGSSASRLVG